MEYFLQQTVNGLTLGSIYGLIALGYTMVYGIVGMINFAHGEIYMIGAFISLVAFAALGFLGITWLPAAFVLVLLIAVAFTCAYGWTLERLAYRPLRNSFRLAPLISAIGASIFLQSYVQILQGARTRSLPSLLEGGFTPLHALGLDVTVSKMQLLIICMTMLLMAGVFMLVNRTRFGRAQRAVQQDKMMASRLGIRVDHVISMTFVLGAALAAAAGLLVTMYYGSVDFFIGFLAGLKAFTAAVLGGIGSVPGAILGGMLIGLIEVYWGGYVSGTYKDVSVFMALILVLLFLPTGLLGSPDSEKV